MALLGAVDQHRDRHRAVALRAPSPARLPPLPMPHASCHGVSCVRTACGHTLIWTLTVCLCMSVLGHAQRERPNRRVSEDMARAESKHASHRQL